MKRFTLMFTILFCLLSIPVISQGNDDPDLTHAIKRFMEEKRVAMTDGMDLTDHEAHAFWPVYEEYQVALRQIVDRRIKLIVEYAKAYKTFSDDKAKAMTVEHLDIESEKLRLKKIWVKEFSKFLPPKKVMRYLQLENKMEAGFNYEVARYIPLVK
jgi:hypothetical protein